MAFDEKDEQAPSEPSDVTDGTQPEAAPDIDAQVD